MKSLCALVIFALLTLLYIPDDGVMTLEPYPIVEAQPAGTLCNP